jgi:hypothetical protein
MKQRSFAQWKLFDDTNQWRRGRRPPFAKLDEARFDL